MSTQGTDYKSAPAEQGDHVCELGEAKSAPAEDWGLINRKGRRVSAKVAKSFQIIQCFALFVPALCSLRLNNSK